MKDKVKQISKNTLIYGLGNTLNKFMGIFLIPMYAAFIPIGQFGVLAVFEMAILFLANMIPMGIPQGHERYFFKEKEKGEYGIFLFSLVSAHLIVSLLIVSLFIVFRGPLAYAISGDAANAHVMVLVCIALFFEVNNQIPLHQLQYENKPVQYAAQNLMKLLLSLGITLYLVIHLKYGIDGVFLGRICGSAMLFAWQVAGNILPRVTWTFRMEKVKQAVTYGFPVILANIGFLVFLMSDRYLVNMVLGNDEVGKYSFGYRMASIVLVFTQAITVSYLPTLFSQEKEKDNKRYYVKMLTYYAFITSWLIMGFLFFYKLPLWPLVQNREYWDGLSVVPVLCFAFIAQGMIFFTVTGVYLTNKNRFVVIPNFAIAGFNIVLNLILLPVYGIMVAAWVNLLSHLLLVLTNATFSRKFYGIRFEWRKVITASGLSALFLFAGTVADPWGTGMKVIARTTLLMLYPLVLYYLDFFEPIELKTIRDLTVRRFLLLIKRGK